MDISLPITEALALAASQQPLPPVVRSVRAEGRSLHVGLDLRQLPQAPLAVRLVASAVGTVEVTATFTGYRDGVAHFSVASRVRNLPVHTLVNALTTTLTSVLRARGLEDVVEIRRGEAEPVVALHLQRALGERVEGVLLQALELRDAVAHASLLIAAVVRRRVPPENP